MSRKKNLYINYVIPIIGVIFIIVWGILVIDSVKPLDTATGEQVWNVFSSHGYTPLDLTEIYIEENPNIGLIKNTSIRPGDFQLEFYEFDSAKSAKSASTSVTSNITEIKRQNFNNCIETRVSKTNIFNMTLRADGKYYFITRIDNTILYAYGTEESASEILSIAEDLGYTA